MVEGVQHLPLYLYLGSPSLAQGKGTLPSVEFLDPTPWTNPPRPTGALNL